jgi:hypothetical protein
LEGTRKLEGSSEVSTFRIEMPKRGRKSPSLQRWRPPSGDGGIQSAQPMPPRCRSLRRNRAATKAGVVGAQLPLVAKPLACAPLTSPTERPVRLRRTGCSPTSQELCGSRPGGSMRSRRRPTGRRSA